jgi:HPt (histidine-containing phosphotransfer) domain-containing protein
MASSEEKIDIQAVLAEMKKGFAKNIPAKVAEVRLSWDMLKTAPYDLAIYDIMHRKAHNLASSGEMLDLESIADFARKIELTLQEGKPGGLPHREIEKLLEKLEAATNSAGHSTAD